MKQGEVPIRKVQVEEVQYVRESQKMKSVIICSLACLLLFASPAIADDHFKTHTVSVHGVDYQFDNVSFDLDDGTIVLTHEDRGIEIVEITEDYELFINGSRVDLDEDQQELVAEFYESVMDIISFAKQLGWEGARIGADGAKLGLQAIGGLFKVVFTSYDTDDFERDIEREAEKIEAKAEKLEKRAERIEDMADDLVDLAREMDREIPELDELGWF